MGLQKYHADYADAPCENGAIVWHTQWMGGPTIAKVMNCPVENRAHIAPRAVYITGEADTWFSTPAVCAYKGKTVRGYVTGTEDGIVFRAMNGNGEA